MYVTTTRRLKGTSLQRTTSWRTGRLTRDERHRGVASNPPQNTGDLGKDLSNRLKYFRRLNENLNSQPGYGARGHTVTSDAGHAFFTSRLVTTPGNYLLTDSKSGAHLRSGLSVPRLGVRSDDFEAMRDSPYEDRALRLGLVGSLYASSGMDNTKYIEAGRVSGAITNGIPDHAEMGWGETVVEFARGNFPRAIPSLIKRAREGRKMDPRGVGKDLGSDYLNLQFGILPIMRDVQKTITHLQGVETLLYSNIKRARETEPVTAALTLSGTSLRFPKEANDVYGYSMASPDYTIYSTSDVRTRAKFSKAQPSSSALGLSEAADFHLRSFGVNEKLAWDLIPFSFLVDWSGSIGSSIENAAAFNPRNGRYVSNYMWKTRKTTYYAEVAPSRIVDPWNTQVSGGSSASMVVLDRTGVSPFGPNFSLPSLSSSQWAILSALGLSFSKR